MFRPFLLVAILVLGGCTLVDQTTFNPGAGKMEPISGPPGPAPSPALITIDFDKPSPVYETALRQAVDQAVARKPDVVFDVTTIVPATGTAAEQIAAASALNADARGIARIISSQGVDDDRVNLSALSDSDVTGRQVRVYVH